MAYKILIVDDETDIVEMLKSGLSREGYTVSVAYDGEEALAKVKADDPDIILLDLIMPKLNGFEVLKEIREKYQERWRPVIIISAKADLDSTRKCYQLEADHYLIKPCSLENILHGIKTMVSLIPQRKD
jgi:DNA-binding response OmpR family regulator